MQKDYHSHLAKFKKQDMRYKLTLSYDGSDFCGWQIQPDAPSVQETLEKALSVLLRENVAVTGAGRTDTGVNARNYVAHFDCVAGIDDCHQLCYKLNAILPGTVVAHSIEEVAADFHARFDAKKRTYRYYLHRAKDPFCAKYSYLCGYPELDFDAMNEAAVFLLGRHDFSCFEKSGADAKTSICTVSEAKWEKDDEIHWHFTISADRFLRNMVRAVVGTLIEVGRGKRSIESVASLPDSGDGRCAAGESVPGHALFLESIEY